MNICWYVDKLGVYLGSIMLGVDGVVVYQGNYENLILWTCKLTNFSLILSGFRKNDGKSAWTGQHRLDNFTKNCAQKNCKANLQAIENNSRWSGGNSLRQRKLGTKPTYTNRIHRPGKKQTSHARFPLQCMDENFPHCKITIHRLVSLCECELSIWVEVCELSKRCVSVSNSIVDSKIVINF